MPVFSFAQEGRGFSPDDLIQIRAVPERGRIQAGESLWIALEQTIKPDWHTYWQNPGDSGAAPRIDWSLPDGFTVSEMFWPAPHKIPYGPLTNYGYSDKVTYLYQLTAPQDFDAKTPVMFDIAADVLVCQEECIPVYREFSFTLNSATDEKSAQADNAQTIAAAKGFLPEEVDMNGAFYTEEGGELIVAFPLNVLAENKNIKDVQIIPAEWGGLDNAAPSMMHKDGRFVLVRQKRGDRNLSDIPVLSGVVRVDYNDGGESRAFSFMAPYRMAAAGETQVQSAESIAETDGVQTPATDSVTVTQDVVAAENTGFLSALVLAFLGGLVLNLMPCVFPVLSIKALSLVKLSAKERTHAQAQGLAYAAGVVLSFLAVAGALLAIKSGGAQIGWGFQLQNPVVVAILAYLVFVVGLNLAGYFEMPARLSNIGGRLTQKDGVRGSFFTGVLATVVATPCSAPFMAGAVGYALTQSVIVALGVFAMLGFGLAAPYVLLCFVPATQKILPKPGAWMENFRQFLAFPMFATAVWLVWVMGNQAGNMAVMGVLFGMVSFAFGFWLMQLAAVHGKRAVFFRVLMVLSFVLPFLFLPVGAASPQKIESDGAAVSVQSPEQAYSPARLDTLLNGDLPVFVEMTADWCITCKVNHKTSLGISSTRRLFSEQNVQYLVGDWTNQDSEITAYLQKFGRSGVPVYVFYGKRDAQTGQRPEPALLPQILTPGIVEKFVTESE